MAPTIPYFCSPSPRGQCASDPIAISSSSLSSSGSDALVILSSATLSTSSVVIVSPGSDEARGGQRSSSRHWRTPSPAPSAVSIGSPTVVTIASFANGSGHTTTSRRTAAAPQRCASSCSVLSVRASGGVAPAPPSSGSGDDEATSRPKRKAKYRKWDVDDERKVLATLAELRKENLGVHPQASVLLEKIRAEGGLRRRGVDATELSEKVYRLKQKFMKVADKVAASGGRRLRNSRNRVLLEASMGVWWDLLPYDVMAAVQVQVARAARRRGNGAMVFL